MGTINKIGLLSDVHNDLDGLRRALQVLDDCDIVLHLGDLVEDAPEANGVVDLLREGGVSGVVGYHDELALQVSGCLAESTRTYLTNLPRELRRGDFHFIHDHPLSREKGEGLYHYGGYIKTEMAARKVFEETASRVLLVGHTHRAEQYAFDGDAVTQVTADVVRLDPAKRYILNPGPVCVQLRGTAPSVGVVDLTRGAFVIRKLDGEVATA